MLITNTPSIEGKTIKEYQWFVSVEVIHGANFIKDIFAAFTDFFWWRSSKYEHALIEAKNMALDELIKKAKGKWADAVINVILDYEVVGKGTMFMVNASGTAVTF